MDFIEKWKMKLFGRGVQTFAVEEIDEHGRVLVFRSVGKTKRRANSIVETWDSKGSEIHAQPVNYITDDHLIEPAYIVNGGETIDLFTRRPTFPDRTEIVGKAATMDDIADALDLNKSMKHIVLGGIFSAPVWWIIFQMLGVMFS
jgi:hypothetical protein